MSRKPSEVQHAPSGSVHGQESPGGEPESAVEGEAPGRLLAGADLRWLGVLWVAAILFFWPVLFGGQSFYFRDTLSYYYPAASLTSAALRAGEIPLWEPGVGLGYPYLADPHSMVFYPLTPTPAQADANNLARGSPFPAEYGGDAFLALHGSWNRKSPVGYKVVRIRFKDGQPVAFEDFLTGFLASDDSQEPYAFGRPAGLVVMQNGSLLVGDDTNGFIYRVS